MEQGIPIFSEKNPKLIFKIHLGINESQINALISYTQKLSDKDIADYTSDWKEGKGRFASPVNFYKWLEKGRTIYTLIDQQGKLSGIIWFGNEPMSTNDKQFTPDFNASLYNITYAIRLYGSARGVGLAAPFTRSALSHFKSTAQYKNTQNPGIWLVTSKDNIAAVTTYKKIGGQEVSNPSSTGRVLMVFPE
jgi:ribosomal protein S18 acetylase RimI-like enzyme